MVLFATPDAQDQSQAAAHKRPSCAENHDNYYLVGVAAVDILALAVIGVAARRA